MPGVPRLVAELGPGQSLGVGAAALLAGAEKYTALDVVAHSNNDANRRVFDDLLVLYRRREDIPGADEFPQVKPLLASYTFPHHLLPDDVLQSGLEEGRIRTLREALGTLAANGAVRYRAPWHDQSVIEEESVDFLFSQAVLEHVDDLAHTYRAMAQWLKPGGMATHQIDFRSHGTHAVWNGHWAYGEDVWRRIRGKMPYLINRCACSDHFAHIKNAGLEILESNTYASEKGLPREALAEPFKSNLTDDDLTTSGLFVVLRKPDNKK